MPQVVSLQSGSETLSAASGNITISSVNLDHAVVLVSFSCQAQNAGNALLTAYLSSATNIAWRRENGATSGYVHWWVIEFDDTVNVQRGSQTVSTADTDISISAVTLAESFALGLRSSDNFSGGLGSAIAQFVLTSTTNLQVSHFVAPLGTEYTSWQVVSCPDFAVQSGTISLAAAAQNSATISAVDVNQTFLVHSAESSATSDEIRGIFSRLTLTNSTTVTANVPVTGLGHTAHFYAVDVEDAGTAVQRGLVTIAATAGDATQNVTITAVDTNFAVALLAGAYGHGGMTSATVDQFSDALVRVNLTSTTNLEMFSDLKSTTSDFDWQVIEFAEYSAPAAPGVPNIGRMLPPPSALTSLAGDTYNARLRALFDASGLSGSLSWCLLQYLRAKYSYSGPLNEGLIYWARDGWDVTPLA